MNKRTNLFNLKEINVLIIQFLLNIRVTQVVLNIMIFLFILPNLSMNKGFGLIFFVIAANIFIEPFVQDIREKGRIFLKRELKEVKDNSRVLKYFLEEMLEAINSKKNDNKLDILIEGILKIRDIKEKHVKIRKRMGGEYLELLKFYQNVIVLNKQIKQDKKLKKQISKELEMFESLKRNQLVETLDYLDEIINRCERNNI